jgi:hypothetical protein
MNTPNIVPEPPDPHWVERLRRNNYVWLPKNGCYAQIAFPYEPPDPGTISGRIGLQRVWGEMFQSGGWGLHHIEEWFIFPDGRGFDGTQLMLPTEGNLDDDPPPLDHSSIRRIMRQVGYLQHRVEHLESEVAELRRRYQPGVEWE